MNTGRRFSSRAALFALLIGVGSQVSKGQGTGIKDIDDNVKIYKDIAKTCMKGNILECLYKAFTLSPSAGIDDEKQIQADAQTASECNAALEKMFPVFRTQALNDARLSYKVKLDYQLLEQGRAELARMPESPFKQNFIKSRRRKIAEYKADLAAVEVRKSARRTVKSGLEFCIRTLKRHDSALGGKWEAEMRKLTADWDAIVKKPFQK